MKTQIEIITAHNNSQCAIIDGNKYEFEFSTNELASCINNTYSLSELESLSGLDSADYTGREMSHEIATDWNHDDVILLIADFIADNSDKLIDHLTVNAN